MKRRERNTLRFAGETYDEAIDRHRNEAIRYADRAVRLAYIGVGVTFLGIVIAVVGFVASRAGASSYPYAGLGGCSPDVTHTQIDPTTAWVTFTVPDGCAPQNWLLIVEDYRGNAGHALPSEGRARLVEEHVTATAGQPVEWAWTSAARLCGGQVDLVLEGEDQPYAAAVFESAGCEDVGTTATPPPAPDNTTPPGAATSVAGVAGSGGGAGADTSVATEATAGPAPLVQIATQPRVGTLPATLPETGGFTDKALVIGLASLGGGVLAMVGSALEGRPLRRGRASGELTDIGPGRVTAKDEAEYRQMREQLRRDLDEMATTEDQP